MVALERALAPEKDARIIAIQREEQREAAQCRMEVQLLRRKVALLRCVNNL